MCHNQKIDFILDFFDGHQSVFIGTDSWKSFFQSLVLDLMIPGMAKMVDVIP